MNRYQSWNERRTTSRAKDRTGVPKLNINSIFQCFSFLFDDLYYLPFPFKNSITRMIHISGVTRSPGWYILSHWTSIGVPPSIKSQNVKIWYIILSNVRPWTKFEISINSITMDFFSANGWDIPLQFNSRFLRMISGAWLVDGVFYVHSFSRSNLTRAVRF